MEYKYVDRDAQTRHTALRGSACRADTEALSGLILWICSDGVRGKPAQPWKPSLTEHLCSVRTGHGSETISAVLSLCLFPHPVLFCLFLSPMCHYLFSVTVSIFGLTHLTPALYDTPLFIISTISFSACIRMPLVYLVLLPSIRLLVSGVAD